MITINGVPARVWQGETAAGVPIVAAITSVALDADLLEDQLTEFSDVDEHAAPRPDAVEAFDLRLLL